MKVTCVQNTKNYIISSTQKTNRIRVVINSIGKAGLNGKSAYQYALDAGYTGTEEEFTEMLLSIKDKQDKIEIGNPKVSLLDLYNLGKL